MCWESARTHCFQDACFVGATRIFRLGGYEKNITHSTSTKCLLTSVTLFYYNLVTRSILAIPLDVVYPMSVLLKPIVQYRLYPEMSNLQVNVVRINLEVCIYVYLPQTREHLLTFPLPHSQRPTYLQVDHTFDYPREFRVPDTNVLRPVANTVVILRRENKDGPNQNQQFSKSHCHLLRDLLV